MTVPRAGLLTLLALAVFASARPPVLSVGPPEALSLSPGTSGRAEVRVTVAEGFHVQANPAANEFLIPLALEVEAEDGLEVTGVEYPPSERFRLQGADEDLLVYDGTFTLSVFIRAPAGAPAGGRTVRGRLRYQACDDRRCLPPSTVSFDLGVQVRQAEKAHIRPGELRPPPPGKIGGPWDS